MSDIATLVPGPTDAELAASALRGLDAALDADTPVRLSLGEPGGEVEVPRSVLAALARVLDSFAHGEGVWFPPNRGGFGYAASPAGTAVLVS